MTTLIIPSETQEIIDGLSANINALSEENHLLRQRLARAVELRQQAEAQVASVIARTAAGLPAYRYLPVPLLLALDFERARQEAKFPDQKLPNRPPEAHPGEAKERADEVRADCDELHAKGDLTWAHVLFEEALEAVAEEDPLKLKEELIQVAAVCFRWIGALDAEECDGR